MPDRLGDFLENSEPSRHKMTCPKCGDVIKGQTSLGVRMAMRFHRNHTCTVRKSEAKMTKQEDGAAISAMADTVVRAVNEHHGAALGSLTSAITSLEAAKAAAENQTNEVARICGEDDPATDAIVGNTANVSQAVETAIEAINAAVAACEPVQNAAGQLGFVYQNVGADIQRAGGGQ